jgi:hypothetical protein
MSAEKACVYRNPIEVGPIVMKAGEYYVGDLTHVLDTAAWQELHVLCDTEESKYGKYGRFTLSNGRIVVIYNLPSNGFRRTLYDDLQGRVYEVSSGTIGLTLAKGLEGVYGDNGLNTSPELEGEDWSTTIARLAHIVKYKKKFNCMSIIDILPNGRICGGDCEVAVIHFGYNVCINTDESQGDACDTDDDC